MDDKGPSALVVLMPWYRSRHSSDELRREVFVSVSTTVVEVFLLSSTHRQIGHMIRRQ